MASLSSYTESKARKSLLIERRPILMLKDFLRDDMSSCSSSGFQSFPRRTCCTITVRNLLELNIKAARDSNIKRSGLLRSRSKATSTTIYALQKASEAVINAVKNLPFTTKSPSQQQQQQQQNQPKQGFLPRSLSRKLFKRSFWRKTNKPEREIRVIFSYSPPHSATAGATTTTTTTTTTARNSNSWSDIDFASDCSQSLSGSSEYSGENEAEESKNDLPTEKKKMRGGEDEAGENSTATSTYSVDLKEQCTYEEKEQFSPVSVLDFPDEEDEEEEETPTSFQQSLAAMERKKKNLMQKIRRFESLACLEPVDLDKRIESLELDDDDSQECAEDCHSFSIEQDNIAYEEVEADECEAIKAEEKARELLKFLNYANVDNVLGDFFRDEIMKRNERERDDDDEAFEQELLRVARDWMNGSDDEGMKWGTMAIVSEMDKGGKWRKFQEEEKELVLEMEIQVSDSLVEELLVDLFQLD